METVTPPIERRWALAIVICAIVLGASGVRGNLTHFDRFIPSGGVMMSEDSFAPIRNHPIFSEALSQLDELLARDSIAFLFGAGTSYCESMPLMAELTAAVLADDALDEDTKSVLRAVQDEFDGGKRSNIEDFLSELSDHLAIATRRDLHSGSPVRLAIGAADYSAEELQESLAAIKLSIAHQIEGCKVPNDLHHHRKLIAAMHRSVRPGRRTNRTFDYLVLNYDTFIEDALSLEKVIYADGLEGGPNGWWSPESTFSREGVSARVLKLHGSIDWAKLAGDPFPRRRSTRNQRPSPEASQVMIWPASTKYAEAQRDPFAQLIQRARKVLNPPPGDSRLLLISGYSFGDTHINAEVDDALRQSDGRLTVVAFIGDEEPPESLSGWLQDPTIGPNVLTFGRTGFWHGLTSEKAETDLPWWKFETLARIAEGEQ
ncbi:SIR2 family protein [Salinibacterium sp. TMP30]|uniref:SIR2 family protein n=1 Tax=Salinibacterium sp. TMP30 TaxID=3138237 RepID=UPI003138D73F